MIDCHAHYYSPQFQPSMSDIPDDLVVIAVSETVDEAVQILDLSKRFPSIKACAGIHPEYITNLDHSLVDLKLSEFDGFMESHHSELIGIGECGLDYSVKVIPKDDRENENKRELQRLVLRKHINYGKQFDLPLVIILRLNVRMFTLEMLDIMRLKSCMNLSQVQYCMHLMGKLIMHYRVYLMVYYLVFHRVLLDLIILRSWLNKFHCLICYWKVMLLH